MVRPRVAGFDGMIFDPQTADPQETTLVGRPVDIDIGMRDRSVVDTWTFFVCTPAWLAQAVATTGSHFGRHHLVVARYEFRLIEAAIDTLCVLVEAPTWDEVVQQLDQYGARKARKNGLGQERLNR